MRNRRACAALAGVLLAGVLSLPACAPRPALVLVQLVTDYAPGRDFDALTVTHAEQVTTISARTDGSYGRATRVTEIALPSGEPVSVSLALLLRGGVVQTQPRRVTPMAGSTTVVTFLVTRDCASVRCPDAADADALACVGGACVSPECSPEHPERCPACPGGCAPSGIECVENACRPEGLCFAAPRDDRCAAGEVCVAGEGCVVAPGGVSDAGSREDAAPPEDTDPPRDTDPPEDTDPPRDTDPPEDTDPPRDAGPRADVTLPDAGSGCGTVATVVGTLPPGRTLAAWGLASSPDGTAGLRGMVLRGAGSDWAGADDLSGASRGTPYLPPPGSASGPVGVAFLADGTTGAVTFGLFGLLVSPLFGLSTDPTLAGSCPSSRCIASAGTDFAVLRGPTALTLVQIHIAPLGRGAVGSSVASAPVATGTTGGGVRPAAIGVLVSYVMGTACVIERWPDFVAQTGRLMISDCTSIDVAELASGEVGIGWTDSANAVHAGVAPAALASLGPVTMLDASQAAAQPVEVASNTGGFRVTWVDDATPLVRSAALDATATQLLNDCAAVPGHVLADYRLFHAVRRGASSAVEWPRGPDFFGASFVN